MTIHMPLSGVSPELVTSTTPTPSILRRGLKVVMWTVLGLVALILGYVLYTNLFLTGLGQGQPAPNFTTTDLQGRPVQLSAFAGHPVMLTFWSPECFACRQELSTLQAIANQPQSDVVLLTIVSRMPVDEVKTFMQEENLTFPVIVDEAGVIPTAYQVSGIPFTYFINPDGTIKDTMIGAGAEDELGKTVNAWVSTCKIDAPCTPKQ